MLISASTNPPKQENLASYIEKLNKTNVDYIHCDVMDGHFVESKTFNHRLVKKINKMTDKKLDVHLMVRSPSFKINKYIKAGADILTVHYEAYKNKKKLIADLEKIRSKGVFSGLSISPDTSISDVLPYICYCDLILIMSVVPGKSGQEFLPETYLKLDNLNKFLKKQKMEVVVEVDGGVNDKNILDLKENKVSMVVMGSFLFKSKNLKKTIKDCQNC